MFYRGSYQRHVFSPMDCKETKNALPSTYIQIIVIINVMQNLNAKINFQTHFKRAIHMCIYVKFMFYCMYVSFFR